MTGVFTFQQQREPWNTCPACGHNSYEMFSIGCLHCGWEPDGLERTWDSQHERWVPRDYSNVRGAG